MKSKLTKETIINQAFAYADQYGLEKLSMRHLANMLGVKAMSLYNHVKNKEDVIESITDKLIGMLYYNLSDTWQNAVKNRARALKALLLEHRWGVLPLMYGFHTGPNITRDFDQSIGVLKKSGFSYQVCDQITSSVKAYIYGYVLSRINFPIEEQNYQTTAEEFKDYYPKNEFPYLWGMSEEIRLGIYNGITDFELGLDFIIKGIETIIKEKGDL